MWGNILPSIELTASRVGQMVIQQNPVHIKMWGKSVCFMSKRKIYHPKYCIVKSTNIDNSISSNNKVIVNSNSNSKVTSKVTSLHRDSSVMLQKK